MGWFDWVRETVSKVTTTVRTGLRGIIGIPEEIEPYLPTRPATLEQIEEAVGGAIYADRFISEVVDEEAIRLSRGVLAREPLTNVARLREWTQQDIHEIQTTAGEYLSVRAVLVGPDGQMTHVDVRFPSGERFTEDEFLRRAASALDDDFANSYDIGRSALVKQYTVARDTYIETFVPL